MKINAFLIFVLVLFLTTGFFSEALVQAQSGSGGSGGVTLINPIGGSGTIMDVIDKIIDGLRDKIAPPIVAIMVLYGGFQMLFAGGAPENFSKGRKTILYAVVGYAIIFIASGISDIIKDILSAYDLFDNYIT